MGYHNERWGSFSEVASASTPHHRSRSPLIGIAQLPRSTKPDTALAAAP